MKSITKILRYTNLSKIMCVESVFKQIIHKTYFRLVTVKDLLNMFILSASKLEFPTVAAKIKIQ